MASSDRIRSGFMSATMTMANLLQASSTSKTHLELCILTSHISSYPQPPANITSDTLAHSTVTLDPPNPTSSDFTYLLSGPLDNFLLYSGQEQSQWLIDIAHDICDPALKCSSLKVWDLAGQMWRNVKPTDPLTTSTYLYDIQTMISLTNISECAGRSKTSSGGNASAMAYNVKQRDEQQCWISRIIEPNENGHLCPKRMGDHLLHIVYSTFVSTPPPPTLSIYDEICGITLSATLNHWFSKYELGLRLVALVQVYIFLSLQLINGS